MENVEEDEEPDDEEMQEEGTEIEYHCPVCSKIFDKVDISYLSSTILDVPFNSSVYRIYFKLFYYL